MVNTLTNKELASHKKKSENLTVRKQASNKQVLAGNFNQTRHQRRDTDAK